MDNTLNQNSFTPASASGLYTQSYAGTPKIDGVKVVDVRNFVADEGDFCEVVRLNEMGELEAFPGFKLRQINRSHLFPGTIKAWHVHFRQDEVWYVPPAYQVFVGLWDCRANSPTADVTMRFNLGGGGNKLLFIPKGVAHGYANFGKKDAEHFYLVSQQFNLQDPDERRIAWDARGANFWTPERD